MNYYFKCIFCDKLLEYKFSDSNLYSDDVYCYHPQHFLIYKSYWDLIECNVYDTYSSIRIMKLSVSEDKDENFIRLYLTNQKLPIIYPNGSLDQFLEDVSYMSKKYLKLAAFT